MSQIFNIYCDESCHLENDGQPVMVQGALWCPEPKAREIAVRLREIKAAHGMRPDFEIKWAKVPPAKQDFYIDVLNYFFENDDLHFRAWVAHKTGLRHPEFGQTHDDWYYKMIFGLLEPLLTPGARFRICLDKKDTRGARKLEKLPETLCNNVYDFNRDIVERLQIVESHAVEQLQVADLLLGAVGYVNRALASGPAKNALVARIKERTGYSLTRPTLLREPKFNVFIWRGRPGKVATSWHFLTEGDDEEARNVDMLRCERIRWPRPTMEAFSDRPPQTRDRILWWRNERNGEWRYVLALPDFSYVVVVADRVQYVLPWTQFCVLENHRKRKLQKEYAAYWQAQKS
jgi:hypothetical protein